MHGYKFILLIFSVALHIGCSSNNEASTPEELLRQSCDWLWSKQADDGGWHSEHHGFLRGGEAWTPFVLNALLAVPDSVYQHPPNKKERALQFLLNHLTGDSVMGIGDPDVLEYPNYATAYTLRVFAKYFQEETGPQIKAMRQYLIRQQFDENRGIQPQDVAYGGWGFGETVLRDGEVGHLDLSHTRRVLQALQASGGVHYKDRSAANQFLMMCQKHPDGTRPQPGMINAGDREVYDGGFYYSPVIQDANKGKRRVAGSDDQWYFASYATATCDGYLALRALGLEEQDTRADEAMQWLLDHPTLTQPEGIPEDDVNQWHLVMKFYHLCVRSEAYAMAGLEGEWQQEMFEILKESCNPNGSFANPMGQLNKEDDPIMCTALAITTLTNCL